MFSGYFPTRNYMFLYLHIFGEKIGNRLLEVFTGVVFYHLGMPLPFILLFFGLEFGLRGVLAPLSRILVAKIGLKTAMATSYIFLIIFFTLVFLAHVSLVLGFFAFIFKSISRAIYYPCVDTLHSVFVRNGSRGKQYSLELVIASLAGFIAVWIGTSILTDAFVSAGIAIVAFLVLAIVPLFLMEKISFPPCKGFLEPYRNILSPDYRENLLPFGAQSIVIIANVTVAPIFIYSLVHEPSAFGTIVFLGILIEMVCTLFYGVWIDKSGHQKSLSIASYIQGVGNFGYLFATTHSVFLAPLTGFNSTAWNMYASNYSTRTQQKALKSSDPLLFNTTTQMTLCFVEIIALSLFALIAWLWGTLVFAVVFVSSIVSLFIATRYFKD